MYQFKREKQISFTDFNQPQGMQMNPNNRWVKKAAMIPWETIEAEYAKLFPSHTGMPAKPLRMALGSLLIQKQYRFPDEELVEQIRENPYYQYFIGLPGYEDKVPFVPSLLVEFRKRLSEDVLNEINEMIIAYNTQQDDDDSDDGSGDASQFEQQDFAMDSENAGTLILDATCAPQNIKYPQDIELLNEARKTGRHDLPGQRCIQFLQAENVPRKGKEGLSCTCQMQKTRRKKDQKSNPETAAIYPPRSWIYHEFA